MRSSPIRLVTGIPRVAAMALLATACAVTPVLAQQKDPAPLRSLEDAIESSTDAILMPTGQPGTLTFRNCREPCKLRSLEVTAESKFLVGATEVTLADFNAYVQRTGPQFLMVFREPDQTRVIRLQVFGQLQ